MGCMTEKSGCKARCLKIGVLAVLGVGALGCVVMLLWNWLIPTLFVGAQPVSYCQALGILLLSKILFGSWRCGGHGRWKERRQQWENMTPEEREQLKGHFKSRWANWCCSHKPDDSAAQDTPTHIEK